MLTSYIFAGICLLIASVVSTPISTSENGTLQNESALENLFENFKNFNASKLFDSFRLPSCVQDCVNEIGSTLASLTLEERWSLEKTRTTCRQFDAMKKCLSTKPGCSSMIIDIGMHAFTYLCNDEEANTGLIPCIRRETLKIHAICERSCRLGATLLDAVSLNSKTAEVWNFLDEKGNKILSVPDLHHLCNSSTCFLSCMRVGIDEKCPNGGSAFVDNIMDSLVKEVSSNHILPETRVVDAYASIVSSFLPRQCQYLILEEKDIILTTPGAPFTFVTAAHTPIETSKKLHDAIEDFRIGTAAERNSSDVTVEVENNDVDARVGDANKISASTITRALNSLHIIMLLLMIICV